jgi:hypothetical protein
VTPGRGFDGDDDGAEGALEVIDLEPGDDITPPHRDAAAETLHRRRGPVVIALAVLVALVAATIASRTQHASRRTTATTDARHTNIDLGNQQGTRTPTALFPFRVGAQILTGGARGLQMTDTDTGRITLPHITGLPPGPVAIVAHSGGTIAARAGSHLYWFSMPSGIAHRFDAATAFASAQPGHLWLASQRFATEVPGDNNRLPRARITTTGPAIGATSAGLLVVTKAGVLLQPSAGTGTARLLLGAPATVIGVHRDRVAWVADDCGILRCPVHITEIASGATSNWVQLAGHPSRLAIAGSSAVFSSDGGSLAIVVPNESLTGTQSLTLANLRTRATKTIVTNGQFEEPARPGSNDATGATIDWTLDGAFLVVGTAPPAGSGRIAIVDPEQPLIVPSNSTFDTGTTAAAIGVSTLGSIDPPRHGALGPIETRGPTVLNLSGLHLLAADQHQVDVLDPTRNQVTTFSVAGPVPNAAGPNSIARVVGGWLVVRAGGSHVVVDLLPDGGGPARVVAPGFQVFSSDDGRLAWIVDVTRSTARSYDPVTARLGSPEPASDRVVAVDGGLVVPVDTGEGTRLDVVGPTGRVQRGPLIASPSIHLLAGAGTTIAFTDQNGLHAYDVAAQKDVVLSPAPVATATLSPDGTQIAWIESDDVMATRLDSTTAAAFLGGTADRVLVADNGTVLYTSGVNVRRGRVDQAGSSPVLGLGPDPAALLALG